MKDQRREKNTKAFGSGLPITDCAFLDKRQLRDALGLTSTRIIDEWVRKRMITSYKLGHRTRLFRFAEVVEDLARFRISAIGRSTE